MSSRNRDFYLSDTNLTQLELYDAKNGTGRNGAWPLVHWVKWLIERNRSQRKEIEVLKRRLGELEHHVYNGPQAATKTPTGKAQRIAAAINEASKSGGNIDAIMQRAVDNLEKQARKGV